ncbi:hypothetical protein [Brevundimonas sp.]|uniref:hypothetical protein n=1 Tax=Brevundimonas sp. TaxID=1871086 RepID=UPI0028B12B46|nr:hypothetical protein [Brevundimonas sp.]
MDDFKRDDPNVIAPIGSTIRRAPETIIVERETNIALWWVVGILLAAVVFGLIYFLTRSATAPTDAELRVIQAEAAADNARQTAEAALAQNQLSSTRDSVAIAQAQSATARAEAIRAQAEARAAEARASEPVVVERQTVVTPPSSSTAVVTTTTPQPGDRP